MPSTNLYDRLKAETARRSGVAIDSDGLLDLFLSWAEDQGLSLYPAQEEAILAIFGGQNVILNTPTGSGKSLVATAMLFMAIAQGKRAFYTCPIKALVNEKFLGLCRDFGPERVGMQTGDAAVNRDAPIICCTAEILSNMALREGDMLGVDEVVMDEFHYYSDRERGAAWQIPLLSMAKSRFLLMSATLGDVEFFQEALTLLTGLETSIVRGTERPVPLKFEYSESPLHERLPALVRSGRAPVYMVCFTQAACAEEAQNLMSLDFCTKEEKKAISEKLWDFDFRSPYGKDVSRFIKHGIGVHHAGLLPRYRTLIEKLAQQGLLKVICGTDTLGVGVNVPIRTVLFTKLCKYDGEKTTTLSARDFQQIAGRAGRKGFDDEGLVVAQAPEHAIENLRMDAKAKDDPKKAKKMVRKQPPKHGFVHWDQSTFDRLVNGKPERLVSRFQPTHAMTLNVLSRLGDGCGALRDLIRRSHEPPEAKKKHAAKAFELFRSLVDRNIIEIIPRLDRPPGDSKVRVNVSLQDDFSLNQSLSLFLLDSLGKLDPYADDYALDALTLVESILESPDLILRKQLDRAKGARLRELKAEGMEYDQRMEELEKVEYPKPRRDFIYTIFNEFREKHPWVGENIRPKSIAREMYELYLGFGEYVREYEIQRAEGLLLRYISDVYKTLVQGIPELAKNEAIEEIVAYFGSMLRAVDSSLVEEWERMRDPKRAALSAQASAATLPKVSLSPRERTIRIRNETFQFLRLLARRDLEEVKDRLAAGGEVWTDERLTALLTPYFDARHAILTSPEARGTQFTDIKPGAQDGVWRVTQRLIDPERADDWEAELEIELADESAAPARLKLITVREI